MLFGDWLSRELAIDIRPSNEPTIHLMVILAVVTFVVASCIPFVPGAEIGFALLVLFGGKVALLVYTSMVSALLLAYAIGILVPLDRLASLFRWAGLRKAYSLTETLADTPPSLRAELLLSHSPRMFARFLLKYRDALLVVLFNLPGNSVLGGGGGIAFTAGVSGLFRFPGFLSAVLVAVAPVPLIFAFSHLL